MRKSLRSAFVASLLVVLLAVPRAALAWHSPGHMAVAYVAYQQLTPAVRARALQLLALNPNFKVWQSFIPAGTPPDQANLYLFMMASTWPDEIKAIHTYSGNDDPPKAVKGTIEKDTLAYSDMALHKYWHFVNSPIPSTAAPAVPPDALTEIIEFRTEIASNASDAIKSYDLVWLEHMVGDIHQPLHCANRFIGTKSDGGGNSVVVTGSAGDLHTFWDDLPGLGETKNYPVAVKFATSLTPADPKAAADTTVADWAQESYKLAVSDVYTAPILVGLGPYTITPAYQARALADAKLRVALAGARLANLLNANLK